MCVEAEQGVSALSYGQWASWTNGVGMPWASVADSGMISIVDMVLWTKPFSSTVERASAPRWLI